MTKESTIPRQREGSPIERIFPGVELEQRERGNLVAADFLARWVPAHREWQRTEPERIAAALDAMGYMPVRVAAFRGPAMQARHDAALRTPPLRNARGVAGRDPRLWGAA